MKETVRPRDADLQPQHGFYPFFGVNKPFDPEDKFVTARFLSPRVFGFLRLFIAFYGVCVVAIDIGLTAKEDQISSYFSYFTDISYIALTVYFVFAGAETLWYSIKGRSPLNRWWRPFQLAHTLLYSTIVTFPILVTIVYWSLLASSSTFATPRTTWANISKHALNSAFILFEIIFSAVGMQPWSHLIVITLILGGYLGVAYITRATLGFYVYSFLNPDKGGIVAAYIVGIFIGALLVFAIVNCVAWALKRTTRAKVASVGRGGQYGMRKQSSGGTGALSV